MKARNKEKTKAKIIDKAIRIFIKDGFLEGSTEDIARRADLAHGTIFYYYPKKSDLVIASIYKELGYLAENLDKKSRKSNNIKELCYLFIKEVIKHHKFYARLIKDLPLLPIKVQRMVFASMSGFSVHFVEVMEKMKSEGKMRGTPYKIPVFFWFGVINYIFSYDKLLGAKKLSEDDIKEIIQFFINGIKK